MFFVVIVVVVVVKVSRIRDRLCCCLIGNGCEITRADRKEEGNENRSVIVAREKARKKEIEEGNGRTK